MPHSVSSDIRTPVRWACVGLGGFGGAMSDQLSRLAARGLIRYVAASDPDLDRVRPRVEQLKLGGVSVSTRLEDVLASDAEVVWLPVPIDLHLPFTRQVLAAGKAVLCEKPAAGVLHDVDAMIAARDAQPPAAKRLVAIGFQQAYDPKVREIKRRLHDALPSVPGRGSNEFGRLRHASVLVSWPRDSTYYGRNDWAGRWKRGDTWVLDSPVNNAMAHFVHLPLFLLGEHPDEAAQPVRVEAEHYRANPIETYDTAGLRITTDSGVTLTVLFTHAAREPINPVIHFVGDKGELTLYPEREVVWPDGRREPMLAPEQLRDTVIATVSRAARGELPPGSVVTLESARTQSLVVSASVQAARVCDFPAPLIDRMPFGTSGTLRAVRDLEPVLRRCFTEHLLPSETGLWPWAPQPAAITLPPNWHFTAPAPQ